VGFTLRRAGNATVPATVHIWTTPAYAESGFDYVPLDMNLAFAPGQVEATFSVTILDDGVAEPLEKTFRIDLDPHDGPGGISGWARADATIVDDDPASATP